MNKSQQEKEYTFAGFAYCNITVKATSEDEAYEKAGALAISEREWTFNGNEVTDIELIEVDGVSVDELEEEEA